LNNNDGGDMTVEDGVKYNLKARAQIVICMGTLKQVELHP
jgi:hypothetical protein